MTDPNVNPNGQVPWQQADANPTEPLNAMTAETGTAANNAPTQAIAAGEQPTQAFTPVEQPTQPFTPAEQPTQPFAPVNQPVGAADVFLEIVMQPFLGFDDIVPDSSSPATV